MEVVYAAVVGLGWLAVSIYLMVEHGAHVFEVTLVVLAVGLVGKAVFQAVRANPSRR